MKVEVDKGSGFCFGVTRAIGKAEEELRQGKTLYCLGDIVHNGREVERLRKMGLVTITHDDLPHLQNVPVLLRAHGEPPSTYQQAEKKNIHIVDATCPVVLHLQERIKKEYTEDAAHQKQIVIYGKAGHAEVLGLVGQTEGTAFVVEQLDDLKKLDFSKDISLYSQTTKSLDGFHEMVTYIQQHINSQATFSYFDTICRQVANRMPHIREFAEQHDVIFFVCGQKSSNGRVLFNECKVVNPHSYMIDHAKDIDAVIGTDEFFNAHSDSKADLEISVGICGATSTPYWLMEECKVRIEQMFGSHK